MSLLTRAMGRMRSEVEQRAVRLGSRAHIYSRWPLPFLQPWRQPRLKLWSPGKGIGDEVLCTAVFDAVKLRNPGCEITFVSRYPELFAGHRSLSAVLPDNEVNRAGALPLVYAQVIPPLRPLTLLMAECVGLRLSGPVPPSLPEPVVAARFQEVVGRWRKPLIVVQPQASRWTPNKDWPLARWNGLTRKLSEWGTVVECGSDPVLDPVTGLERMAGQTSVLEFAHLVRCADLFIGPPSGGMHLAAAFGIPSLILYGGYEHPDGHQYANVTAFYRAVSCAPCWLTTPCPVGRMCLDQIHEDEVFPAAVDHLSARIGDRVGTL